MNGFRNRYVAGESDIGPQKHICGWRVRYCIWPSETDMWLESQIYGLRNRYVAGEPDIWTSETDLWLESQI